VEVTLMRGPGQTSHINSLATGILMRTIKALCLISGAFAASLPLAGHAHHSFAATFDGATIKEIEGVVTSVKWSNPHVHFTLKSATEAGQEIIYEVEGHSLSLMRRMQIPADAIRVGETIRVAGNPALNSATQFFARTALLSDGREIVVDPWTEPRWAENLGTKEGIQAAAADTTDPRSVLFRVWSTALDDPGVFPFPETINPAFVSNYPLTEFAREALAAFDPDTDTPTLNCAPKGMPAIMEQPYPMEFVDQREVIVMRIEEYDLERTIHMNRVTGNDEPSLLGHSTGYWDGDTLVVETTNVNWGHFDTIGIPLTERAHMVERFTPGNSGLRLDYELSVTDPQIFTESVNLTKYWIALDGIEIRPYQCTN
jgi:hypothetical protein